MELNGLNKVPHPPYSQDIVAFNFFLFEYTKDKLQGFSFNNRKELLDAIKQIWDEIPKETLREVFWNWKKDYKKLLIQMVIIFNKQFKFYINIFFFLFLRCYTLSLTPYIFLLYINIIKSLWIDNGNKSVFESLKKV